MLREAADELMAIGPGQVLKFECGHAYERIGALPRAREVLAQVAEDDEAPSPLRANAYALLVRVVGPRLEDWAEADRLVRNWIRVRPGDTRASALAPIIASRLAAARRQG